LLPTQYWYPSTVFEKSTFIIVPVPSAKFSTGACSTQTARGRIKLVLAVLHCGESGEGSKEGKEEEEKKIL